MFKGLKQQWRAFKKDRPGKRFEARYERNKKERPSQSWMVRIFKPAIAIVLLAGGVLLCFIPGPGIPLIIIGAGLLADEWRALARAMDWLELRLRKVVKWAKGWWETAPRLARHAVIALAVLAAGGAAYGGYRFIASH